MTLSAPPGPPVARDRAPSDQRLILGSVIGVCSVTTILILGIAGGSIWTDSRPPVTVGAGPGGAPTNSDDFVAHLPGLGDSLGRRLGAGLVLVPQRQGATQGFAISGESEAAVLEQARLQHGDLLVELDGRPLTRGRIPGIERELASLDAVEIRFVRNGLARDRTIDLTR